MNPQYQKMLRQVQDMQKAMAKAQEELAQETVEASAGGGMVTVVVTGGLEVREVRIDPDAVDPDDVEMLQDLVTAATNEGAARRPGAGPAEAGRRDQRHGPAQHPRPVLAPRGDSGPPLIAKPRGDAAPHASPGRAADCGPESPLNRGAGCGYPLHSGWFSLRYGRRNVASSAASPERDCPEGPVSLRLRVGVCRDASTDDARELYVLSRA